MTNVCDNCEESTACIHCHECQDVTLLCQPCYDFMHKAKSKRGHRISSMVRARADSEGPSLTSLETVRGLTPTGDVPSVAELDALLEKQRSGRKSQVSVVGAQGTVYHDGHHPARWVSDSVSTVCSSCSGAFSFFKRKHHCRKCGQCFCSHCTSQRRHLPSAGFLEPVRMCDACILSLDAQGGDGALPGLCGGDMNGTGLRAQATTTLKKIVIGSFHSLVRTLPMCIVIIGLPGAGKKSVLSQLELGSSTTDANGVCTIKTGMARVHVMDVNQSYEPYTRGRDGVAFAFVVDCADMEGDRSAVVLECLESFVAHPSFSGPLLILANKQDTAGAYTPRALATSFALDPHVQWCVQASCALNGEGVSEGFDWLATILENEDRIATMQGWD